ncbi:MAG: hypothetical protein QXZ09_05615 [Candidatus Methanomethylicaceae archaeon]
MTNTFVILENCGEEPFHGLPATFNGVEYKLAPGQKRQVPLAAVIHFLGNWALTGRTREFEHQRLKARYGHFDTLSSYDIETFIHRSQALSQAAGSKNLPKAVKSQLQRMAERLPQSAELPQLRVIDPDTDEEFPVKWPLYDPHWAPEEDNIPAELRPVYDALLQRIEAERKDAARHFVERFEESVGTIDDLDE